MKQALKTVTIERDGDLKRAENLEKAREEEENLDKAVTASNAGSSATDVAAQQDAAETAVAPEGDPAAVASTAAESERAKVCFDPASIEVA